MPRKKRQQDESPAGAPQAVRRTGRFWVLSIAAAALATGGALVFADWWTCFPDDVRATYVGRDACTECHASETRQWEGSDHDRAMDLANDETVLGDFNDAVLTHHGVTSRMFRNGSQFMIHTEGPDGNLADFEVKYVFGIRPLQQYMVEFDRPKDMPANEIARLQVLRVSWDTERKRWFYLPPPDVPERLSYDDDLHWTGIAQRWNNMCAYCHSTDLKKEYDVETLTYHTTFSEIDVSCEACHGPGSVHVQLANDNSLFWDRKRGYGLAKLKGQDTRPEIQTCAPCHSRRQVHYPNFLAGDDYYDFFNNELLDEATYYADGQIMDEDYVFGSFIQSKMFHQDIRCSDCHNPHTARPHHEGNKVCTSCHQHPEAKYDTPAHHFHKSDSTGASCVECHMPETTYMEVDPRRDHSIRIPRPDLSVELGLPNACTRCHLSDAEISDEKRATLKQYLDWIAVARDGDLEIKAELKRLDQWMLESMQKWYQKDSWGDSFAYALTAGRKREPGAEDLLAKIAQDRKLPGIVRATAVHQRGYLSSVQDFRPEIHALTDEDPQVRAAAAARFFDRIPNVGSRAINRRDEQQLLDMVSPSVKRLIPLLDDESRVVRAETGRVLARLPSQLASKLLNGTQRELLDNAIDEHIAGINESNDRGGAHMALGVLYESMGRDKRARSAYRTAIRVEPRMTGPRSNLCALLERSIEDELRRSPQAPVTERRRRVELEVQTLRQEELKLMARDARLLPDSAGIQYRYGLALYLNGDQDEAETALKTACRLERDNDQFLFALVLFYDKYERFDEALEGIERLVSLRPDDPQYASLREQIRQKQKEAIEK